MTWVSGLFLIYKFERAVKNIYWSETITVLHQYSNFYKGYLIYILEMANPKWSRLEMKTLNNKFRSSLFWARSNVKTNSDSKSADIIPALQNILQMLQNKLQSYLLLTICLLTFYFLIFSCSMDLTLSTILSYLLSTRALVFSGNLDVKDFFQVTQVCLLLTCMPI